MSEILKIIVHLIQDFQPIAPFYTNILMEKKLFIIEEISNFILPFYFYSSFITLTLCFVVIGILGHLKSLIMLLCLQVVMLLVIALMRPRKMGMAQLVYGIGGATNVYKSVLRTLLITTRASIETQMGSLKTLRYLMLSLAAWLGQGIYNQTNNYNIIIALSLVSIAVAGVVSVFLASSETSISYSSVIKAISSYKALTTTIKNTFHKNLIVGLVCGSSSSLLQIYLGIFSQTIFHEKAKDQQSYNPALLFFYQVIDTPIYGLSYLVVRFFSAISPIFAPQPKCDKHVATIKSGYIEGTTRILAGTLSIFITGLIPAGVKLESLLVLFFFSIIFFFLLNLTSSVGYAQILYFFTFTTVICSEILGKSYIYQTENRIFVSNLCVFAESLVHALFNYICRLKGFKSKTKGIIYGSFAATGFLSAVLIKVIF
ncbi:hypothetical protein PAEPH01_0080 [Pancytospora epiphaga]|nr:hypothetical protein PAEPH01_0080 [Pancytospora epiphaga]